MSEGLSTLLISDVPTLAMMQCPAGGGQVHRTTIHHATCGGQLHTLIPSFIPVQPVVDRFTRMTLDFTEKLKMGSRAALPEMFKTYTDEALGSTFTYRTLGLTRPLDSWRLTDFFASAAQAGPAVQV